MLGLRRLFFLLIAVQFLPQSPAKASEVENLLDCLQVLRRPERLGQPPISLFTFEAAGRIFLFLPRANQRGWVGESYAIPDSAFTGSSRFAQLSLVRPNGTILYASGNFGERAELATISTAPLPQPTRIESSEPRVAEVLPLIRRRLATAIERDRRFLERMQDSAAYRQHRPGAIGELRRRLANLSMRCGNVRDREIRQLIGLGPLGAAHASAGSSAASGQAVHR